MNFSCEVVKQGPIQGADQSAARARPRAGGGFSGGKAVGLSQHSTQKPNGHYDCAHQHHEGKGRNPLFLVDHNRTLLFLFYYVRISISPKMVSLGIRFVSATRNIDTDESNPTAQFILHIFAAERSLHRRAEDISPGPSPICPI